jgi:hypothetical protein
MTSNLLSDPQYWLDRAEEIRVLAERSVHAETKRMLETISPTTSFWRGGRRNDYAEARQTTVLLRRMMGIGLVTLGKNPWQGSQKFGSSAARART